MSAICSAVYKPPEASGLSGVTTGVGGTGVFSAVGTSVDTSVGIPDGTGAVSAGIFVGWALAQAVSVDATTRVIPVTAAKAFPNLLFPKASMNLSNGNSGLVIETPLFFSTILSGIIT
jgi:hypothetical protein